MRQPAHDELIFTNQLLTINAQILPLFMRPTGHGKPPGNERRSIFRPAGHNGNAVQIDVITRNNLLLTGRATKALRRHIQHLFELRKFVKEIAKAPRRFRFFQKGQQLTHFTQCGDIILPHPHRDALWRAKQVTEHRHGIAFRIFKQQRGSASTQRAVSNFGDFQVRVNFKRDAFKFALLFKQRQEVA